MYQNKYLFVLAILVVFSVWKLSEPRITVYPSKEDYSVDNLSKFSYGALKDILDENNDLSSREVVAVAKTLEIKESYKVSDTIPTTDKTETSESNYCSIAIDALGKSLDREIEKVEELKTEKNKIKDRADFFNWIHLILTVIITCILFILKQKDATLLTVNEIWRDRVEFVGVILYAITSVISLL